MAVEIKVPAVGESITEGTIARWLKANGASVQANEPVCEVETDKATTEVMAPVGGRLAIAAKEGQKIAIGDVIGQIEEGAAAPPPPAPQPSPAAKGDGPLLGGGGAGPPPPPNRGVPRRKQLRSRSCRRQRDSSRPPRASNRPSSPAADAAAALPRKTFSLISSTAAPPRTVGQASRLTSHLLRLRLWPRPRPGRKETGAKDANA